MIYLYWSFPTTALTLKWSFMIPTIARTPTHHVSFTRFAHRVLTITTLWIVIKVIPNLEVPALIAEPATLRWVVLPQIPPHRLNCHLYDCMVKSNAMALIIVLQHAGYEICEECEALQGYDCPDEWLHEETGYCSDCDAIVEVREEHHGNCAMRALCRLALTCSEYARRAPGKTTLLPGV